MDDLGHRWTEKELAALERRIKQVYGQARKDLQKTVDEYFEKLIDRDKHQQELLKAGKITEEQYKQWRLAQIGRGKRFEALRDKLAERYTKANETAIAYVNDATPGVYSLNRNYGAYTIEQVAGDVGFNLWDEQTVKRLIVEEPDVMPYYPEKRAVNRGIDLAYGKRQISASVTSGILQGLSIGKIANDLQERIQDMNRTSAVRAARTAMTNAQNAGRQDSYVQAAKMGIKVRKRWIATKDMRTRHEHGASDGQTVDYDKPFDVGGEEIMFPGDRSGSPWNTYNCRCTMRTVEKDGIETEPRKMRVRDPETGRNVLVNEMTYAEWAKWKESAKTVETPQKTATIEKKEPSGGGGTVQTIGRIDIEKYKVVSSQIRTEEVVITDERIDHIKEHHPNDFERYSRYISTMLENPQYILQDPVPNTAIVLQEFSENNEHFRLILKLAVTEDEQHKKNSVITFLKISKKKFGKYLRNKKILYKSE